MKPAKKKAAPKPAAVNEKASEQQRISDLAKALIESQQTNVRLRRNLREIEADYLELSETIAGASAVATRIVNRHSIGRRTVYGQGVEKPQF